MSNHQDAFRSPQRDTRMEGMYRQEQSPYAPPAHHGDAQRSLSYPENHAPQPIRYTSAPHPYPPYHPMMAPTPSSDSSFATYPPPPFPYAVHHPSFESHASGGPTPYVTYSYGAPPPPHATVIAYPHYPPWAMPPKIQYIQKIEPEDVLCGRGGATNSHSGNRAFRLLVKRHQDRYLKAKKRDKPAVASHIVELIRERGGRFLRKCDSTPQGNVLWVDIGDVRAREKTCQALREGAPELRRRKSKSFDDKEKVKRKDSSDEESLAEGDGGGVDRRDVDPPRKDKSEQEDKSRAGAAESADARDDNEGSRGERSPATTEEQKEPLVIRPSARLMKRSTTTEITMAELTPREREMYLRDFLPPDATMRVSDGSKQRQVIRIAQHYEPVAEGDDDDDDSMMDKDDDDEWEEEE